MKFALWVSFVLFFVGGLCLASTVMGAEPDSSYNFEAIDGFGTSRSYQQGLGARVDRIFGNNIFTGFDYTHYFGNGRGIQGINLTSVEGGYRFQTAANFELIPYLGMGAAFLDYHQETTDHLLTSPGLKIDYPIGQLVLGLDNQCLIVPSHNTYSLALTFGIRF
jgi:hypothetical protein